MHCANNILCRCFCTSSLQWILAAQISSFLEKIQYILFYILPDHFSVFLIFTSRNKKSGSHDDEAVEREYNGLPIAVSQNRNTCLPCPDGSQCDHHLIFLKTLLSSTVGFSLTLTRFIRSYLILQLLKWHFQNCTSEFSVNNF